MPVFRHLLRNKFRTLLTSLYFLKREVSLKKETKKVAMKNSQTNIFSFCILILLPLFSLSNSGDWKLKKNENGIEVYTRYAENSPLKEVRVITEVQSSLSAIIAL